MQCLCVSYSLFKIDDANASHSSDGLLVTFHRHDSTSDSNDLVCPICCDQIPTNAAKQMPCCSSKLCSACLVTHTVTSIRHGQATIECPCCSEEMNSSGILYNSELSPSVRERYQQILAQQLSDQQNTCIKLCPHCNFITIVDENDARKRNKKLHRSSQSWIHCEQCEKDWCWSCYSPSHPTESCQQFQKTHTQLDTWAKRRRSDNNNQRNAQRCPKCAIYIEKIDGCDHMICSKCTSKFCYRCGSRMRLPFYVGHDAKYSIFGCKYKLWPNRPLMRWLVRGSVFAGVLLLTPVILGAIISLIAIGIPTVLIVGCFGLPVLMCLECKKRR